MLKTIHKARIKSTILVSLICLLIGGALLYFTVFSVFKYIQGPTEMQEITISSELEKEYVSYPVTCLVDGYVETYSKGKYELKSSKDKIAYVALDPNTGAVFGIEVKASKESEMEEILDASWDYFNGDTDSLPDGLVLKGSFQKIKGEELDYFKEALDYYDLDYPEEFYVLEVGYINGDSFSTSIIISILGAVFALVGILMFVSDFKTNEKALFDKFIGEHPEFTFSMLESDFDAAENIKNDLWIGKNFTFTLNKEHPVLIHEDLKHVEFRSKRVSKRHTDNYFIYTTKSGDEIRINIIQANAKLALEVYQKRLPSLFEEETEQNNI